MMFLAAGRIPATGPAVGSTYCKLRLGGEDTKV